MSREKQLSLWKSDRVARFTDLRGMRFGLLRVPEDCVPEYRPYDQSKPGRGGPAYWPCTCECGAAVVVMGKQLRELGVVSCKSDDCRVSGLLAVGRSLPKHLSLHVPPVGAVFGRLTVLAAGTTRDKHGKRRWLFRCECGTVKEQFAAKVVSGEIQSCGCLMREAVSTANRKYSDRLQMFRNSLLSDYKRHAVEREFAFEISQEEFFALTKEPCHYCGRCEVNVGSKRYDSKLPHNGVDRLDSSLGYVPGNCVACCKICNIMKQRMSVDGFIAHLELILAHTKGDK